MNDTATDRSIPIDAFVMIIGAMKSGTSSLYSYLCEHPQICPCKIKEPEYFSDKQSHGSDILGYEGLWDFNSKQHKYALEASTGYTKFPTEKDIPKKIFAYGLRPKFIYLVRDPIDRIESHINFMKGMPEYDNNIEYDLEYMQNISNYSLQLQQYEEYFSENDILVLEFSNFIKSPHQSLQKVCEFLEIKEMDFNVRYDIKNKTRKVTKVDKLLRKSSLVKKITNYLPRSVIISIQKILLRFFQTEKYKRLSLFEKNRILSELSEQQIEFSKKYSVDLDSWDNLR